MAWWFRKQAVRDESVDPRRIMLDATLSDLRRVSSELQQTNEIMREKVERLKESDS